MPNAALYSLSTLIWGSTWLVITFQFGTVSASASVAYRFLLAGLLLLAWCRFKGDSLALPRPQWRWVGLQGVLMFGLSYMLVYEAERHIASGLMAVLNSSMVVSNLIAMRLAFGQRIDSKSLLGASLGVCGIALIFWPELTSVRGDEAWLGVAEGLLAVALYSGGNAAAQRNRNAELPLLPTIAWGMLAGGGVALLIALYRDAGLAFDWRPSYLASLLYLALLGSIVAFIAYLTLLGRIGAGKAGYVSVSVPVVALLLSAWFEGFHWQLSTVLGIALAAGGNVVMLTDIGGWWQRRQASRLSG